MTTLQNYVSIHPYFKVRAGQLDTVKPILREFIALVSKEPRTLFYEFSINENVVFCREGYVDAASLLEHVEHTGTLVQKMLAHSDLIRCEVHGPASELEKLKGPLAGLKPEWYAIECGIGR